MTMSRIPDPEGRDLTLAELTRAAGVSVRTVRYYIAEGLLPPPVGAGPRSAYTRGHLDRLRVIARFKTAYLPLKEIRRRLAGLDDDQVRRLLATEGGVVERSSRVGEATTRFDVPGFASGSFRPDPGMGGGRGGNQPMMMAALGYDPPPGPQPAPEPVPPPLMMGVATPLTPSPVETETEAWRRVRLSDDAELLIRDDAYQRRRDLVDWLVRWARKVFG